MIELIMLGVGVFYLSKLLTVGSAGTRLGMPYELLERWRTAKRKQYFLGMVAGLGAFAASMAFLLTADPCYNGECTVDQENSSLLGIVVVTFGVLILGFILTARAGNKAKMVRSSAPPIPPEPARPEPLEHPGWGRPVVTPPADDAQPPVDSGAEPGPTSHSSLG